MKIETTLFYSGQLDTDFNALEQQAKVALAESDIHAKTRFASDYDLALALGGLTLTLALSPCRSILRPWGGQRFQAP